MSDNVGVLKEFLVGIGFNVDPNSYSQMDNAILSLTAKAIKLGSEFEGAAAAVVAGVAKIASGMEQLYYVSARTNSTVENIQAISYAATQMGSSAAAAKASLEGLGNFLRSSPGAASVLEHLGVSTSNNGKPRDETAIMTDLGQRFSQMPIWLASKYASMMGIDQNTLFAMINGLGQLTAAYKQMWQAAGLDPSGNSQQAHNFMVQLRTLGEAFDILAIKVEASLAGPLAADIEQFRKLIVDHFGDITAVIDAVAKGFIVLGLLTVGALTEAFDILHKLSDIFHTLDPQTKQWLELLGGVLLAWKAMNLAFALSPIGAVLLLVAGLLLLYQDYETWKHGGKSLIDWSKWQSDIDKAEKFFTWFHKTVDGIVQSVGGWQIVFASFLTYFVGSWSIAIISRLGTILGLIAAVGRGMLGLGGAGVAAGAAAAGAGEAAAGGGAAVVGGGLLAGAGSLLGTIALGAGGALYGFFGNPFDMWGSGSEAPLGAKDEQGSFDFSGGDTKGGANPMARQIRDLFVNQYGWSKAAADGIVANLQAEDSTFDPNSSNGDAYGIAQWMPDRQKTFQKLFGKPMRGSSLGEQLAFLNFELQGKPIGGVDMDAGSRTAGQMLKQPGITDLQATQIDTAYGERAGSSLADSISIGTQRAKMAGNLGMYPVTAPSSKPCITIIQHNDTKIVAPSSSTAKQLADHQGMVAKRNARNLQSPLNNRAHSQ
jgi:hypothetical protein